MLRWIAGQVSADPSDIESYGKRDPTRREHFLELLQEYSWRSFGLHEYREMSAWLMNQARSTDLGMALITLLISELQHRRIVVPVLPVLERLTIAARSRARRKAYRALNSDLTFAQRQDLDRLRSCAVNRDRRGLDGYAKQLAQPTPTTFWPASNG